MIKGPKVQELPNGEEIYDLTNGGYDIYRLYLGKTSRVMQRPWGKKESHLSWGIYCGNRGYWHWKDQATEESGTAIQFVEKYFGLNSRQARKKICQDFGLFHEKPVGKIVTWEPPEAEEYCHISFDSKPFEKEHHEFWNAAEVTEEDCKRHECYAVRSLAINRRIVNIKKGEPVFAYFCSAENGVKIYFPTREKDFKFRNNVSFHYLWGFENIPECNDLIIQKSNKDKIVTSMLAPHVISTQSEAVKIFNEETRLKISQKCKTPTLWYGSDPDGAKKAVEIVTLAGYNAIITPPELLPDINDTYLYAKQFKLKGLEEFMKAKHLI